MTGTRAARHANEKRRARGLAPLMIAAAVVAVAVAAAIVIALVGVGSDDHPRSGRGAQADGTPGSPQGVGGSASASPSSSARADAEARSRTWLRTCGADLSKADRVVTAASGGVGHWHSHVQARTDMLEGRISERRMEAVWDRTRMAGPADQKRFKAALHRFHAHPHCDQPRSMTPAHRREGRACVARSKLADRAVRYARGAMHDWETHLANMRKFAHGRMSAALAQGRWVRAWDNAPKNISGYRQARARLAHAPTCDGKAGH